MSCVIYAVAFQQRYFPKIIQRERALSQVVRERRDQEEVIRRVQTRVVRRHQGGHEPHAHPPVNDARGPDSIHESKVMHGDANVGVLDGGAKFGPRVGEGGHDVPPEGVVKRTAEPVSAPARVSRVDELPIPLTIVVTREQLYPSERPDAAENVRRRDRERRPPQSGRRIREQLGPVPMQGHHIHEEVRGFHVVTDGEEHGTEVAVDYAVGPTEVEVRSEIIPKGVY